MHIDVRSHLTEEQIVSRLCRHDPRNPASARYQEPDDLAPAAAPGCSCDNCFYGLHPLAYALLAERAARA